MKGLILAAGRGERLRPLSDSVPKPLLPVGGRPLIHYALLLMRHAGIRDVAINVHHLAGELESALGSGRALGMNIIWAPEPTLLGTGGPLPGLRGFFGAEPFAVLNSDTLMDLNLGAMARFHRDRASLMTAALYKSDHAEDYSRLEVDGDRRLRRIRLLGAGGVLRDFPPALPEGLERDLAAYIFCGAYICSPAVLDPMPAPPFSSMAEVFAPMVALGMPLYGWVHEGFFRTVDDLAAYHRIAAEFPVQVGPLAYLDSKA